MAGMHSCFQVYGYRVGIPFNNVCLLSSNWRAFHNPSWASQPIYS